MTDEQKLNIIKQEWKRIANWGSIADFKSFLDNVTKKKVINFLKIKIQQEADKQSSSAQAATGIAQDLSTFKSELDTYLN